jgi:hypothetical protein
MKAASFPAPCLIPVETGAGIFVPGEFMIVRTRILHRALLVFLGCCALGDAGRGGEDDPAVRDRFLKGVRQAEQKLKQISFRAKCAHSYRNVSVSDDTRAAFAARNKDPFAVTTSEFECAIRGECSLMRLKDKHGIEKVRARNKSYAFVISQGSAAQPPTLQFLEELGRDPAIDAKVAEIERDYRGIALAAYSPWGIPLWELVRDKGVKIQRVFATQSEGRELVRLEFQRETYDSKGQVRTVYDSAYITCDPANVWAMVEYGSSFHNRVNKESGEEQWRLEFGDPVAGIPVAKKLTNTVTLTRGSVMESVLSTEVTSRDEVPEAEFHLTHYGLPEPNFGHGWWGVWVWYLLAAIVSLGAAWVMMRRRRAAG